MTTQNPLIQWIAEMFQRLISKSPTFFKVWKIIAGIPFLIIALPNALQVLNIHLPQVFSTHIQDIVGWASTAMLFMSFLPTQSTATGVDKDGNILKKTNEDKLPFTVAQEQKALEKKQSTVPQLESVGTVSTKLIK